MERTSKPEVPRPDDGGFSTSDAQRLRAETPEYQSLRGTPSSSPATLRAEVGALPERRLIDATELFAAMPADVLEQLREHAVVRSYERNETLFHQGDPSDDLFVVRTGRIAIAAQSGDGRESVVAVLEAGGLFGELGLFDDAPRSADARALTESSVIALEYEPVREVLRARPEVLWVILRILSQRLRATDEALADAVFLDVPARTAKRILELAGEQDAFTLP